MTYTKLRMGIAEARAAMDAMFEEAARLSDRPVAMAITDDDGLLLTYARMDGTSSLVAEMAIKKAYTAARTGDDTSGLAARVKERGMGGVADTDPRLTTAASGVNVRLDGTNLGGVAASGSGSAIDVQIAQAGVRALLAHLGDGAQ